MATIADSFLADFEEDDEEQMPELESNNHITSTSTSTSTSSSTSTPTAKEEKRDSDGEDMDMDFSANLDSIPLDISERVPQSKPLATTATTNEIGVLLQEPRLIKHLENITTLQASTAEDGSNQTIDRDTEYQFIVTSNELVVEIDNEIATIHKFARDLYALKYHEMEQLVQTPVEYAKVVKIIGNLNDITSVEKELATVIPANIIITISVTTTTTQGKTLGESDLSRVYAACDAIIALDEAKRRIHTYVETRMVYIAPNLCALIGSSVAARLMGIAGGLKKLAEIPACNIQLLGIKRKHLSGFSTANKDLHLGILAQTDILQTCPNALRNRSIRLLANKLVLITRVDAQRQDPSGTTGRDMRDKIVSKIEKWQEPPPSKIKKALPVPLPAPRKKRGGKRFRKEKERFKMTELQRIKNRVVFGKEELTDEYTGQSFGMIGQEGTGVLKVAAKDTQKLKNRLSQKTQSRLKRIRSASHGTSGTASSIAFTPVQGMELVNPEIQKMRDTADKYFSNTGSFLKVGKTGTSTSIIPTPVPGTGGFMMPAPKRPKLDPSKQQPGQQ